MTIYYNVAGPQTVNGTTSTATYDDADQLTTTTDQRGETLWRWRWLRWPNPPGQRLIDHRKPFASSHSPSTGFSH